MGMDRDMLRRTKSGRVADAASTASRRRKQNVLEIDGVLWALDEHGNPVKRLRKKNKEGNGAAASGGGGGEAHQQHQQHHSSGASVSTKRIKKNIIEIDGHPWLCDDNGKPIKKLRKKVKEGEEPPARSKSRARNGGSGYDSDGASSRGSNRSGRSRRHGRDDMSSRGRPHSTAARPQHHRSDDSYSSDGRRGKGGGSLEKLMHSGGESTSTGGRRKKKVIEIDGQLWACDEQGNPVKKVRRKGDRPKRAASAPAGERPPRPRERGRSRGPAHGRENGVNHANQRPRSGTGQPGSSYTDAKGRKHVFDEFGNESVFDRNGKKLRKKGEPKSGGLLDHIMQSSGMGSLNEPPDNRDLEFGIFDNLLDDLEGKERKLEIPQGKTKSLADLRRSLNLSPVAPKSPQLKRSHTDFDILDDPDELDRRNKMLMEELKRARDEMRELEEQAKREKAKNLKAQNDMMELKADFTKASSELEDLRCKVYDLTSEISRKERELQQAKDNASSLPSGAGNDGIAELEAEKDNLASKLEMERATAQQEIKKKEEELAKMNREMGVLRNEVEMLITGRKGNEVDPTLKRLMEEKQEVEEKYNTDKEQNEKKIKNLEEMIEALETVNTELNKQMMMSAKGNAGTGLGAGPRNNIHTRSNRRDSNFERKAPQATKSFEGSGFSLSPGALFGRGRFGRQNDNQ